MNTSTLITCLGLAVASLSSALFAAEPEPLRVLNFQADNGFKHKSMSDAKALVERLGKQNGWEVISTADSSSLLKHDLSTFDTIVFNNNCGNKGAIMTPDEQAAFRTYVQNGGGFLAVHGAGAIWKEGDPFQAWYEGLVGTKLIDHPKVQKARLVVEDRSHPATSHLPEEWMVVDEFHRFDSNPREKVNVLISVDEDSYKGKQKMGGDHPFVWYHEYDGGRSFFTSLGHTKEIYSDPDFEKLVEGAILWTSGAEDTKATAKQPVSKSSMNVSTLPVNDGLFLDLDANLAVDFEDENRVKAWHNQVQGTAADVFVKRDKGRKIAGSGRPTLKTDVAEIGGNNTLIFEEQELINMDEDAFDHLVTGSGYTWFSVMSVYKQNVGKKDVNSFFGNLRNGNPYDGFWGNVMDDNIVWMGTRNGFPSKGKKKKGKKNSNGRGTPGLWDDQLNPCVQTQEPLEENRYYLVMGRMGAGTEVVDLELFINSAEAVDRKTVPVNPNANASMMAVGQERDATNHPGFESFHGEIARFLIFERPLSDAELTEMVRYLTELYEIQ
ncbi:MULTISPECIES: ThuA domain-containing protein [unclassified Lentimonas]|uniref:ThuA domain-containing protein n=1 Tax=unclassified Lentimonas TaxID=2630993 RepID=UPI00132B96D5|nr:MULTISPECIES: ThuA domain-containing protein [unclassified Lentimonas]CAA6677558.1 Cytochrome c551/c552 [Lentimonas sp. CC4]CAA6684345.1 Cytochrome c551/c552 [Lentimonas sp. CC6]CAA7078137.1 Cytochrome c551/c552 [Lentimonas sp. CC4]CAA7168345.1 Cytochrome c551/c552 [Lentimonas sp. CC21]CAA7181822.1 Cytochrome c551/c552 [Lentimonas sp. CC8]